MAGPAPGESALVIFLPTQAAQVVNIWRRRYDPYIAEVDPHITLAYPPFVPETTWPSVRPAVQSVIGQFSSFSIQLRRTGVFTQPAHVLWLQPENSAILEHIHAALKTALPEFITSRELPFVPHVTLGFFQELRSLENARRIVDAELSPLEFPVTEVCYLARETDPLWGPRDCLPFHLV